LSGIDGGGFEVYDAIAANIAGEIIAHDGADTARRGIYLNAGLRVVRDRVEGGRREGAAIPYANANAVGRNRVTRHGRTAAIDIDADGIARNGREVILHRGAGIPTADQNAGGTAADARIVDARIVGDRRSNCIPRGGRGMA